MRSVRGQLGRMAVLTGSLLVTASVVACGSTGAQQNDAANAGSGPPPTSPTTSTSTTTPAPTTSSSSPAPTTTTSVAPAAPADCKAATLELDLVSGDAAAGTVYRTLKFTNTGAQSCVIHGFPGVSYVTGDNGRQVGQAAYRIPPKGSPITLATGESAWVDVGFVNVQNFDPADCKPTPTRGLRVYPPHDTASMFVPLRGTGCAGSTPDPQLTVKTAVQG